MPDHRGDRTKVTRQTVEGARSHRANESATFVRLPIGYHGRCPIQV
jgi:hypothetical protein